MTSPHPPPFQGPYPTHFPPVAKPPKEKNALGLASFIVAIVGFIFALIPGALIIGWILLPIAFILAIVALFLEGKSKTFAITGLIISIFGTIVGAVVFLVVVSSAFDDAFSGGETTVMTPESQAEGTEEADDEKAEGTEEADDEKAGGTEEADDEKAGGTEEADDEQGTRANPYPLASAITQRDWTVTINSVDLDANADLTAKNMYNDPPDAGSVYILVNLTATYIGSDPDGDSAWASVDYVTSDGNTISSTDKFIMAPDKFGTLTTLYEGASTTGNKAFQVPADTAGKGVLAVKPTMFGDKVFVAVK